MGWALDVDSVVGAENAGVKTPIRTGGQTHPLCLTPSRPCGIAWTWTKPAPASANDTTESLQSHSFNRTMLFSGRRPQIVQSSAGVGGPPPPNSSPWLGNIWARGERLRVIVAALPVRGIRTMTASWINGQLLLDERGGIGRATVSKSEQVASSDESSNTSVPAWQSQSVERSLKAARERAQHRSDRFVNAGIDLISTTGDMGFTVQDVVDKSGMSIRTFYLFFATKDDLLVAIHETLLASEVEPRCVRGVTRSRIRWRSSERLCMLCSS